MNNQKKIQPTKQQQLEAAIESRERLDREITKLRRGIEQEQKAIKKVLKYSIGDRLLWNGCLPDNKKSALPPQKCIIVTHGNMYNWGISFGDGSFRFVNEDSLSPRDSDQNKGYEVGDTFVAENGKWRGYECEVIRIDDQVNEYENAIVFSKKDKKLYFTPNYPEKYTFVLPIQIPIVHCIDPRFWTVEKDGVLYRAYKTIDGDVIIYWRDGEGKSNWYCVFSANFPKALSEALNKHILDYLQVPVMPYGYMGDDYKYKYPEWEESKVKSDVK